LSWTKLAAVLIVPTRATGFGLSAAYWCCKCSDHRGATRVKINGVANLPGSQPKRILVYQFRRSIRMFRFPAQWSKKTRYCQAADNHHATHGDIVSIWIRSNITRSRIDDKNVVVVPLREVEASEGDIKKRSGRWISLFRRSDYVRGVTD